MQTAGHPRDALGDFGVGAPALAGDDTEKGRLAAHCIYFQLLAFVIARSEATKQSIAPQAD
jgi:hypothetical protein